MLGVPFALLDVTFPTIVSKTLDSLASITAPLALLIVGAGFDKDSAIKKLGLTAVATSIKLVIQPLLILPIAVLLGFRNQELMAIVIMLGSPTTVASYVMARSMKNDYVLVSSIVVLTTILSSVSITAIVFILKSLQYI